MAFGMLEGRQFLFVGMCVIFCIALIMDLCQDTEEQILSATAAHRSSIVWRGSRELY